MCRLLGYLGPPIGMDSLLLKPEHSLLVQSYQPQEMNSGVVNADGFGVGWYHPAREVYPFTYKHTVPIWSDPNLESLSRYAESGCVLAYVRSATAGQATQFSNCQPFQWEHYLGIHNGFVQDFRQTLHRPLREHLSDRFYAGIEGTTDSEHLLALLWQQLQQSAQPSLPAALKQTLALITTWAQAYGVAVSANFVVSDGHRLVASRFAHGCTAPSLYWLREDPSFVGGVIVASEPMFTSDRWHRCAENSIVVVGEDLEIQTNCL
jgi:ergothioneine biosynthesis protein EgtC